MALFDDHIGRALSHNAQRIAEELGTDLFAYYGQISPDYLGEFRKEFEILANFERNQTAKPDTVSIILDTPGGEVETVEKMVEIIRHHYGIVHFYVPEIAMSAGTILCMSGDEVYMNYASSLGPIDPQVMSKDGKYVPALGYLDQVEKMIQKSSDGTLTLAELHILLNQDLAKLRRYEQAKDLSIALLEKYLVQYKFKAWTVTQTNQKQVTNAFKKRRAKSIAQDLANHNKWHSHSRMLGIQTLRQDLKLKIHDISTQEPLNNYIQEYHDLILDYFNRYNLEKIFYGYAITTA